jgi:hypothetical protein
MATAEITLTTEEPPSPSADFAFYIDYKRGVGSASRVFAATHDFIKACERIDKDLLEAIDSNIETVMVLEDIEAASLKTFLKNALTSVDDGALKSLNWKQQVGAYLVRAKYVILRWVDKEEIPRDLAQLGTEIRQIASETDVKHLPDYRAPSPASLVNAIKDFQGIKDHFVEGDRVEIITQRETHVLNLSVRWDIASLQALTVKETIVSPPTVMILAVKKPDYLGDSKWELRHGKRSIPVKIEHADWLAQFQSRRIDVRPGDSLKCEVQIERSYGHDHELVNEQFTITRVLDVLVNTYPQTSLFGDDHH